jgi:hypothetical protein
MARARITSATAALPVVDSAEGLEDVADEFSIIIQTPKILSYQYEDLPEI